MVARNRTLRTHNLSLSRALRAKEKVEQAKDRLLHVVQMEMARTAKRLGITKISCAFTTDYFVGDKEVECPELSALEKVFLDVHPTGFSGIWTAGEGWTP